MVEDQTGATEESEARGGTVLDRMEKDRQWERHGVWTLHWIQKPEEATVGESSGVLWTREGSSLTPLVLDSHRGLCRMRQR